MFVNFYAWEVSLRRRSRVVLPEGFRIKYTPCALLVREILVEKSGDCMLVLHYNLSKMQVIRTPIFYLEST